MLCGHKKYMKVLISNTITSTWIFIAIFIVALLVSLRRSVSENLSPNVTQELKGFAILSVIFAHIGYFLVSDTQFLFPLSILAGVGVNLFLFLSGYGLTVSSIKKDDSVIQFYKKRIIKLFLPFWIILGVLLLTDFFILHIVYSKEFILPAVFGIFTHANIFTDFNSPFWYFTFILFFYFIFPLIFIKKYPWISAIFTYSISYLIIKINPVFLSNVIGLYTVHLYAFPLGMLCAQLFLNKKISSFNLYKKYEKFLYPVILLVLCGIVWYTSIHSGVGKGITLEQNISLVTMFALILLFVFKRFEFRVLSIFGLYSYEIYLLHWPLMYRYDFLFAYVPAWLATTLYLIIFIIVGWVLKNISEKISNRRIE